MDIASIALAVAYRAKRTEREDKQKADELANRRLSRVVNNEYFFLRVKPTREDGYDFGVNPDPDGLLPGLFNRK